MDINDLFQMLAEEKAKNKAKDSKKKEKSRNRKGDFLEAFSAELKNLREEEEQHKRDVAAMEAWLTSPVKEKDEPSITEEVIESVEKVEEEKEVLEELADTPLQEEAVKYLHTKREELTEEQIKIKSLEKQFEDLRKQITSVRLGMQGQGGGGAVNIRDMDDVDRSTALVNNKFLKYDSSTGKFVGADASGGGGGISNVVEDTTPQLGGNLDLNSNDITGTGDIDITGEITANEFIGEFRGPLIFKAQADGALSKGDVVFVSGISGNTPTVAKADADDVTKMPAFGLAHDAASDNSAVDVVTFGTLSNLDTSSFTVGDTLYVSTTAGALTNSAPTGESAYIQNIGKVQRAHASAGSIKVGGAGRFNSTGNLNDGNIFIGNSSNQATTSSLETEVHSLLGSVGVSIVPDTTETYDLGSASLRWNDLFLAGETIDLGGTKISKDSSGDVSFKDGSDNLKKVIVDELHIGSGSNVLKLKSSGGKLRAEDNANAKASHDITFSELSSTPTTLSGYGITDAQSALVSGTSIKTINGTSLLGSGNISISGGGGDEAAILDNSGTPELASGITAAEIRTLIGAGTSSFDGAYSSLSGLPTISNDFTDSDHSKLDGIEASADVTDTANVTAAGALMDSEITNLAQVKAFDSSDYATAAQGAKADSAIQSGDLSPYATLASPTLTGTPAAPTASTGTNTTQIATTAFVQQEITALKALLYSYDQS